MEYKPYLSQEMDEPQAPGLATPGGEWNLDHVATMTPDQVVKAFEQEADTTLWNEARDALVYHHAQSLVSALTEAATEADAEAGRQTKAHKAGLANTEKLHTAWRTASDKLATVKPADRGKWEQKTQDARAAHLDAEQGWQTAKSLAHDAGKRAETLRQLADALAGIERPAMDAWRVVLALANGRG